ncbi:uncharacterized protein G2W53_008952 [Senna tora]|uniref:Uncharacterized protein n=1 Tax=Senna tora TaxID=362788 RepID=A0A834WXH6_9FABA|nr:uncharacterized protein G2W53_008952 [Senna tora]
MGGTSRFRNQSAILRFEWEGRGKGEEAGFVMGKGMIGGKIDKEIGGMESECLNESSGC